MKKSHINISLLAAVALITLIMASCGKENYLEFRSGPWSVEKVEQAWYSTTDTTAADSVRTFESDTLGYFNFYHSYLYGSLYIVINYPSLFLSPDFEANYEVHPNNKEILTIWQANGSSEAYISFTVQGANFRRQKWTAIRQSGDGVVRETIWVRKR